MNILLAIDDTKKALSRARAALTTLCELARTPEHREHVVSLQHVIAALEVELSALRYQARHPREAA